MTHYLEQDLVAHLAAFQAVLLLVVLSNVCILRRAARHGSPQSWARVSVLVPARDEEGNIARCVGSLLAQDYADLEVLVLDDQSSDGTRAVLEAMARADGRLRIIAGQALPEGWLGKAWACAQLAANAEGELLYFTDADTVHQPQALRAAVAALEGTRADLLTGFPRQIVHTWGEKLIVPFFSWACYCFVPLALAYRLGLPALSFAIGQMLLFRRAAYEAIGGHAAIRGSVVDDLALARTIKAAGYRWRVLDATALVSCRMYRSGQEAYAGLSKNLFAAAGCRVIPYLFVSLWLLVLFLYPPILLGLRADGLATGAPVALTSACIILALAVWLIPYRALRLPAWLAALYPLVVAVSALVALRSLWLTANGRLIWKGRQLKRLAWRLF